MSQPSGFDVFAVHKRTRAKCYKMAKLMSRREPAKLFHCERARRSRSVMVFNACKVGRLDNRDFLKCYTSYCLIKNRDIFNLTFMHRRRAKMYK